MTPHIVAIDLGSARCGVVRGAAEGPPRVDAATVVEPSADASGRPLPAAVASLLALIAGASRVVLEIGPLFIRRGASEAEALRTSQNWHACDLLAYVLEERCAAMTPPIPVVRVSRQAWARRLVPSRSGVSQADARAAVKAHLDGTGSAPLPGDDRIDAAGAYLWSVLPAHGPAKEPKPKAARTDLPKDKAERRRVLARERAWRLALPAKAARKAAGCACERKHRRGCPMAPPPRLRGLTPEAMERARAAVRTVLPAGRFARMRGEGT
jgi:hypothetical protein